MLALANGLFLAALLVGGVLVPAAELTGVVGTIVGLLPTAALADLLRVALGAGGEVVRPVVDPPGLGRGLASLAARWFRWD